MQLEESPSNRRILYLARHGETEWNRLGRWQGHTDIPLTELGRQQALALAKNLEPLSIERIRVSDLSRARETGAIVARELAISQIDEDADLRERMFGSFEGLTRAQCESERADDWAAYRADPQRGPPGAELHAQVIERMTRAVLRASLLPGRGPILLVTHGGAMRILGNAIGNIGSEPIGNGDMFEIEVVAGRLHAASRWSPEFPPPR